MLTRILCGLAAAVALALTACGEDRPSETGADGPRLETRAADAPRAPAPDAPDRFEYLRYAVDTSTPEPLICLAFSQALNPSFDYAPYVGVEPQAPIAIEVSGRNLCIGGLRFGEERAITLRAGLPAADGRTLASDETTEIAFGDRPAFVGFSGSGVILPRIDADGVAIETVNVATVSIRVLRINDRALAFREISTGITAGDGEYAWLYGDDDPEGVGVVIWEGEMDTAGPANAPVTTVFPIAEAVGVLQAGAYFIEVQEKSTRSPQEYRQPARSMRWLIITDLALTGYFGSDGIDTIVRSLQTAQVESGVRVDLVAASNEVLASATTDARGRVRFQGAITRGEGANTPRLLLAYAPNGDFAVLDLRRAPVDLTAQNIGGRTIPAGADAFVWLDRGVYRPGETVEISAMIRDGEARAITGRPGSLIVYGPNGLEAARHRFENAPNAGAVFFPYDVPRAAARGSWRVDVALDGLGVVGTHRFSVEDFVPQRIALALSADTETPLRSGEARAVQADVRFLYGAPGAGLPVEGEARIELDPNPFPAHAGFRFGRHDETFREIAFDLDAVTADGAGRAVLRLDPGEEGANASRPLRARVVVSAIEPGGRAVRDDVRIPYRPRDLYLGLRSDFGDESASVNRPVRFQALAVDAAGEAQATTLQWRLVRTDWRYDWYREDGSAWRWRRSRETVLIEDGVIETGAEPVAIETRALSWGDYQIVLTEPGSGIESSSGFWVGWGSRPVDGVEAPDRVRLTTPERAPAIGETAEVGILAPYAGYAEIVVASDRVLHSTSVEVPEGGARVQLPVTAEWGAGAYVMVTVYTPRDAASSPRPRRAVGVAHVPVGVDARTFELEMDAPERVRPNQTLRVAVTAQSGPVREGAWVTLAAVDEGILALTRFASPDPNAWYFGRKSLGLRLYDDYGRLLDPNQGAAAPVRSGGDQIGGAGLTVVPTRTVALFSGPVRFDRNGRAVIELDIPDFNGELRLMAVAWSATGLGSASQPMTVRDAVPAELILPRFLAPGDEAFATLTLDNIEGAAGNYTARITTEGPVEAGADPLAATLAAGERRDAATPLTAGSEGIAEIALAVDGPDGFSVARSWPIQVRSPYLPVTLVDRALVRADAAYTPAPDLLAGFVPGSGEAEISFSALPMDPAALYNSLSRYPYGCTEQTISRALPLLYAGQMASLAGIADAPETPRIVRTAVETILSRQAADGAFGLWRMGDRNASPWLGAYATDFLARADAAGYAVPRAALDRSYDVLAHIARQDLWRAGGYQTEVRRSSWERDTQQRLNMRSAAYAYYVLARAGRADRSAVRYMHDEMLGRIESPLARAQLGAALALIGDRARAANAFTEAEAALGYNNQGDYYQTPRRDLAGVLALAAEAGETDLVERLAGRVATDLPEPSRLTTQEKAFLLLAANAISGGAETLSIEAEGAAETVSAGMSYVMDADALAEGARFVNRGPAPVWRTTLSRGAPVSPPPAVSENMTVARRILRTDGAPADLSAIRQGDRLIIAIVLSAAEARRVPAVIADLLPAGFEIEAILRPEDAGETGPYVWLQELSTPRIAEARDDRFIAAIDLTNREPARFAYIVRAVTPGVFAMPGVVAEDMYRPDVFARSAPGSVTISRR